MGDSRHGTEFGTGNGPMSWMSHKNPGMPKKA